MNNYIDLIKSLELNTLKCDFCDIRIEEKSISTIIFENHNLTNSTKEPNIGVFIRVYNNGKWFYKSLNTIYEKNKLLKEIISLIDLSKVYKDKSIPIFNNIKQFEKSIFLYNETQISLKEKKEILKEYDNILKEQNIIKMSRSYYIDKFTNIFYGNSKNVYTAYDFLGHEIRFIYVMMENNIQFMSGYSKYSDNFNDLLNLENNIREEINETKYFINAPNIIPSDMSVIMSPETAGVFAHESFGHKSESDFMIGDEQMKKEWQIGKKVGSEILSIIDEGNLKGVSGYIPFDDEGIEKKKVYLIKDGILSGRLHSLRTAYDLKEEPTGNGRAISTEFEPIVRMTTTYIEKGNSTFNDLVSGIDNGVFIKSIKHGSGLSTFTIAPQKAYYIKNGKIDKPVKVNVITGTVFETLNLIDGVSDKVEIKSSLIGGCGKMEQYPLRVSFGGPYVRVKNMKVT